MWWRVVGVTGYCGELVGRFEDFDQVLVEDVRRILSEAGVEGSRAERCLEGVAAALARTGHVSRARSVAYMMGFCRYMARLVEAYGVSVLYTGVLPGKGTLAHKLLALASMEVFGDWRGLEGVEGRVRRAVDEAAAVLEEMELHEGLVPRGDLAGPGDAVGEAHAREIAEAVAAYRRRLDEAVDVASRLLAGLARGLDSLARRLGLSVGRLRPLAEAQLVDYTLHVIGTPDLVLEDEDSRRAIVVEWKTYEATPSAWEMAQAYVYAFMEARRLGYGGPPPGAYRAPGRLRDLALALAETDPSRAPVVPVVVRPSAGGGARLYSTHPAVAGLLGARRPADPCAVLHLAAVSSLHLAMLLADAGEAWEACRVEGSRLGIPGDKLVAAFRVTPPTLRDRRVRELARMPRSHAGRPATQDSEFPCGVCRRMFPPIPPACRRYFSSSEETPLERMVYRYRRAVLEEHEMDMMVYKALYHASPGLLAEAEEACRQLSFDASRRPPFQYSGRRGCSLLVGGTAYRFNFFDYISVAGDPTLGDALVLARADAEGLVERVEARGLGVEVERVSAVREGKPIAVYLVPEGLSYHRPLTLNANVFARVEEVEVEDGRLVVRAGLPSPSLRLSLRLLHDRLRLLGCGRDGEGRVTCTPRDLDRLSLRVLAAEVTVDLTYLDLRILDLVYRNLLVTGEAPEEAGDVRGTLERLFEEIHTGLARGGG